MKIVHGFCPSKLRLQIIFFSFSGGKIKTNLYVLERPLPMSPCATRVEWLVWLGTLRVSHIPQSSALVLCVCVWNFDREIPEVTVLVSPLTHVLQL